MKKGTMAASGLLAAALLAWCPGVRAADVTILNPSFEQNPDPGQSAETPVTFAVPGARSWTVQGSYMLDDGSGNLTNASAVTFHNTADGQPDHISNATGDQLASIAAQTGSGITQVLADRFTGSANYQLSFDLGVSHSFPPLLFTAGGDVDPTGDLLFSASLFNADTGDPVGSPRVIDYFTLYRVAGGTPDTLLTTLTLDVPAAAIGSAAGHPIGVALVALGDGVADNDDLEGGFWNVDNARLTATAVPEPGAAAILGLSLLGLPPRRR